MNENIKKNDGRMEKLSPSMGCMEVVVCRFMVVLLCGLWECGGFVIEMVLWKFLWW